MNETEVIEMKCGCIIEVINSKHIITQYCSEHEQDDNFEVYNEPKIHKIRKFNDYHSI
jgi:hypothetical protein